MSVGDGIGSFLSGAATSMNAVRQQDEAEKLRLLLQQQQSSVPAAVTPPAGSVPVAPAAPGSASGGDAKPVSSSDPVATDLAPHQRAFLNAISDGESGGKYNIRYTPSGGAIFDDLSQHPGIMEPTADGKKSSAAGRYQFTKTTWDGLGGGDFSPANQDRRAWQLAQSDYKARTGGDLDAELQKSGMTPQIMKALQPTWTSFGTGQDRHIAAYNTSMARYALPVSQSIAPASAAPVAQAAPPLSDTEAARRRAGDTSYTLDAPPKSVLKDDAKGGRTAMQIMGDLFPVSRSIM